MSVDFMDTSNLELSTQALIAEAQRRGVEVEVLDAADNFIVLRRDGRTEYVKQATRTSADTYVSALLMENKAVTKLVLTEAGLRAPDGARYDHETEAAGDFARYAGRRIVVKPNATNFGEGVALLGADAGEAEYRAAVTAAFALDRTVLPGFEAELTTSFVTTPQDFHDRLLSYKGAAFGLEPLLLQSAWFRPHNRSEDIEHLYMVGASTHPGAGVPGVLMSAKALDSVVPSAVDFLQTQALQA
jgi:phytoene dehydrogenase-like protein